MLPVELSPFTTDHVEAAARLLSSIYAAADSDLPRAVLSDPKVAEEGLAASIGKGLGVVVTDGPTLLGFMIAPLPNAPGPSSTRLRPMHHAAISADARRIYRRMYEAISGPLVAAGCTNHSLPVLAAPPALLSAFVELEFAIGQIKGIRAVPSDASPAGDPRVRVANADDVDAVVDLAIDLTKYHSRAPMFHPALFDISVRDGVRRALDDDQSVVLVVEDGGHLIAMMEADPEASYGGTVAIGMNFVAEAARSAGLGTAMLDSLFAWAASHGYTHCSVNWASANLVSDAFYRSRGFVPLRFRLERRVDPRVSWANESLDYRSFPLQ